jgi:hypothetical protein
MHGCGTHVPEQFDHPHQLGQKLSAAYATLLVQYVHMDVGTFSIFIPKVVKFYLYSTSLKRGTLFLVWPRNKSQNIHIFYIQSMRAY